MNDFRRYESKFGLEMPLVEEVEGHRGTLEKLAEEAAQPLAESFAEGSSPIYVEHLPESTRRRLASSEFSGDAKGSTLRLEGQKAIAWILNREIYLRLEEWQEQHPDYGRMS